KVIMLTSSIPHSGKTFVSLNLAATLAASGKNTVVVDFDLRRRTLSKTMGHRNDRRGMTGYLTNKIASIDDIIYKSEEEPNLSFIFSGPQPPNPTEMLMSQRVDPFIEELRGRFDYIIIDSVPAMAVADALIIDRLVDLTVYIIRQGNLDRRHLPDIENLYREKKFRNMSIILNGVTHSKRTYGYGYGYGYGYYSENEDNTTLQRRWRKFRGLFTKR
ncbi:MAG: CpsD/CapB family tyrosine-protein kinase, partial [Alistipes sp.]|nr:CpsD/CapB family tyrosine-protein kinase [Alistipes sp.]